MKTAVGRLLAEPPFRLAINAMLRVVPAPLEVKAWWDAAPRPHYLVGTLYAATQAQRAGHTSVAVMEFGVAAGRGLLTLQGHAAVVEAATGVRVVVYGWDRGDGLPGGTGDFRDHPDIWRHGDYQMNVGALRAVLTDRTTLVLGDITETVRTQAVPHPVGFLAIDVDLYSSAAAALSLLRRPDVPRLPRAAVYLDDVTDDYNHRWAGELLAVEEFNATGPVRIDRWRGLQRRPFGDALWVSAMYMAHDLDAIGRMRPTRDPAALH